ncbi:hypothetical protein A2W14_06350 [Candidatus Gottesmanbacteria bacterium RBG_16_37_8]|uniref:Antitoxin n=1 Tax=Candidatus Gottesmanbacteria bacterium RBG_16_37_8 TaxID=1798371 RepID=A0A1F5YQ62_9BACT|nr:MAG: hypothetical protein A2W14_06350 [Candidatus Gottesmanbacteria bacterium RBG_16_37_8]
MQTQSFPSTISARDIQRGYKKVFEKVRKTKRPVVVMSNNKPQAAIISLDMLDEYKQIKEDQKFFEVIEKIQARNIDKKEEEVMRDVTEAVKEVRKKIYEETFGRS